MLEKNCPICRKNFVTEYPSKIYCSEKCAEVAYFKRDESEYKYLPDSAEPIFTFECAECKKLVKVQSKYDQRHRYCCGKCAAKAKNRRANLKRQRLRGENGISRGMSLNGLIWREKFTLE